MRPGHTEPRTLAGTRIATLRGTGSHYLLMAFLVQVGVDANAVSIEFASPDEITRLWDRGVIDGAACAVAR